jgi:HD-GYP domain-containing protein (c-di-GMP phosphodiesterase class II)
VHPEVDELRPKLKEILYDCAVDIRANKAALYLFDGASRFELVTEYGFRSGIRQVADFNDPLVDRCGRGRTPFFVNGVAVEPRFSELLYETSTDRLLAAPLYSRGKLVGFIDMRDKAGKAPFDQNDVPKAQDIADRMVQLFVDKNVFGHRFIALSKLSGAHPAAVEQDSGTARPLVSDKPPVRDKPVTTTPPPPPRPLPVVVPPPPPDQPRAQVSRLATLVIEARGAAGRIDVAAVSDTLGEAEVTAAREVLRAVLLIPGAVAAMFSAFGHLGGVQEVAARTTLGEEARNFLQSKLNVWLNKRGESGGYVKTSVTTPFGTPGLPISTNDLQKVFTAPLVVGSLRGLYLTVGFAAAPDRVAHELLAALHGHLQLVIEQSMQRGAIASLRFKVAEKLVEPDFKKYPELRRHTDAVASLAEGFARFLALTPAEVENAKLVAIVHDAGMRLLEYERLYRKRDLSEEELSFLREHPVVGAALVDPLLGSEVARAVLCHHERPDGRGYPNELHGDEIPLLSRLVALCDAYATITDAGSYQPAEPPQVALSTISRASGAQFDTDLSLRFIDFIRTSPLSSRA